MDKRKPTDGTPGPGDSDDGLSGENSGRRAPEWSGGHQAETEPASDADPEDLPEHEVDEGTTVEPENS